MRNHPAIVIIAYNRSRSLERLLKSVGKAQYPENQKIPLVISIDKGDNSDVIRVAENFTWTHGEKRVVCRKENLGLKRHVLLCGDYVQEFGSVILLEDDNKGRMGEVEQKLILSAAGFLGRQMEQ